MASAHGERRSNVAEINADVGVSHVCPACAGLSHTIQSKVGLENPRHIVEEGDVVANCQSRG